MLGTFRAFALRIGKHKYNFVFLAFVGCIFKNLKVPDCSQLSVYTNGAVWDMAFEYPYHNNDGGLQNLNKTSQDIKIELLPELVGIR